MLELIRPIVIVTGLVVLEAAPHVFGGPEPTVKIIAGLVIVVTIYALDFAFRKGGSYFKPIRQIRHEPLPVFEGLWLQKVDIPERPYSMGRIEYLEDGRWSYSGIAFSDQLRPAAEWNTYSLNYDAARKKWHFAGESSLLEWNKGSGNYKKVHRGYVSPILELDIDEKGRVQAKDHVQATVIDLNLKEENRVFEATLIRGDNLYAVQLPSVRKIRQMPQDEVRQLFASKGIIQ